MQWQIYRKNGGWVGLPISCEYMLCWAHKWLDWAFKLVVKTNFAKLEGGLKPVKASLVDSLVMQIYYYYIKNVEHVLTAISIEVSIFKEK